MSSGRKKHRPLIMKGRNFVVIVKNWIYKTVKGTKFLHQDRSFVTLVKKTLCPLW